MASYSSGDIVCDYDQIGALLKGSEVQDMLQTAADEIKNRAGDGYTAGTKTMGTRVIASVATEDENYDAMRDNLENNTLLKALK